MKNKLSLIKDFKIIIQGKYLAFSLFVFLIFMVSIFEGISLGSLYPLMSIVLDDTKKQVYLNKLNALLGVHLDIGGFTAIFLLGILVVFLIKNILAILAVYSQYYLSQMMRVDWQVKIFNNYLRKKYEFFIKFQMGDLIQRQMVHTLSCEGAILYLCAIARDVFSAIGILIILAFISFKATLLVIGIMLIALWAFVIISKNCIYKTSKIYANLQQHAYSLVAEAINGIKEIKLFNVEKYFITNFHKSVIEQANIYIKNATLGMSPPSIMQMVAVITLVGIMLVISKLGISSRQVLPAFVVFGGGLHQLIRLASSINAGVMQLSVTLPSVNIVSEMLSSCGDVNEDHPIQLKDRGIYLDHDVIQEDTSSLDFRDQIELKNISFSYPGTQKDQLVDINVAIKKGKFYGIVGPSGCGKTTLVDLLIGLHTLQKGEVILDGRKFMKFSSFQWRRLFGFVSQSPFIFSGTAEQNIAFAIDPSEIKTEKVVHAARLAGLQSVIDKLENGYQTFIGEKGYKLSGGERQRLSIARAIYRDPLIYIFDEATSALDSESEREIQRSIENLSCEKKTVIAIAHRLSTVINADELLVMKNGRIVEQGNHTSLVRAGGFYAHLYNTQYKI